MLGIESEFSISVSQGSEILNSIFPSDTAIFWLSSVTSRVVIPSRERISFSCSPARKMSPVPDMVSEGDNFYARFFGDWHPVKELLRINLGYNQSIKLPNQKSKKPGRE